MEATTATQLSQATHPNRELELELFKEPNQLFADHLNLPNNDRIIFSAKFGMGKTTFLKKYFEENEDKYNVIHLFPVNYSVASNEDIFRYIKHDIILEMLKNSTKVEAIELTSWHALAILLPQHLDKLFISTVGLLPMLGKGFPEYSNSLEMLSVLISKTVSGIEKLKPIGKKVEEIKDKANDGNQLLKYIEDLSQKEGNIFEFDLVSDIILQSLLKLKEDGQKENVLVIDDLDRIDPEHLFRILNVFAAHFDYPYKGQLKNKFGFDRVIFVGDMNNIRNIFRAKYGESVDCNGYFDKFFSKRIFQFSNQEVYIKFAKRQLMKTKVYNEVQNDYNYDPKYFENFSFSFMCSDLLSVLLANNLFVLRNIQKWDSIPFQYKSDYDYLQRIGLGAKSVPVILIIKFLSETKGSVELLQESLIELAKCDYHLNYSSLKVLCVELIKFLYVQKISRSTTKNLDLNRVVYQVNDNWIDLL